MTHSIRALCAAFFACCLLGVLGSAFAGEIVFINKSDYNANFAVKILDSKRKGWYVYGWYTVNSGRRSSVTLNNDPERRIFYYAEEVNERGYWPADGDYSQWVMNGKMQHQANVLKSYKGAYEVQMGLVEGDENGRVVITIQ